MSVVVLQAGGATLRLLPAAGGRITACTLVAENGSLQPVLHPYPEDHADLDHWAKGGLYPLAPYHGRIRSAQLAFDSHIWPLTPHAGSTHTLHGIAQRRPWALCELGGNYALMQYVHHPDGHWPWAFAAELSVRLEPCQVSVEIMLRNTGSAPMPSGIGLHPYLVRAPGETVAYDAGANWPFDANYLAMSPPADAEAVRPQRLDWGDSIDQDITRFHAGWTGALRVLSAAGATRLRIRGDGALRQLVLHRPAHAPYACVEPVSHVADGFNLHARDMPGTGTHILAPGESLCGTMRMAAG